MLNKNDAFLGFVRTKEETWCLVSSAPGEMNREKIQAGEEVTELESYSIWHGSATNH